MRLSRPVTVRLLVTTLLLFSAALLGWYLISPWYTLNRMNAAVKARDTEALARYINYPALREDAKAELMGTILKPLEAADAGTGEFGRLLANVMVGPAVEDMISEKGLERAFGHSRVEQHKNRGPRSVELPLSGSLRIERDGISRFLVKSQNHADIAAEFERSGLRWRLSGIERLASGAPKAGESE